MSIDLLRKLLGQAQTNRLPTDDRSLKKDPRQQLENKTDKQNGKDPNIYMSPLLVAARHGNTEMVEKILQIQPAAILEMDPANKNIFLLAAEHKRFEVLELLREKFSNMKSAFRAVDNMGNNALHAAAKYRPGRWIGIPDGLQMQVETILFETVKKSVPEYILGGSNNENMTPKEVFEHTHAKLVETCRKWLKDISNQCSGLAGIIASVTFATSTAIPGGVTEKDRPKLENQLGFTIFAVSSLIALSSSVTSAVVFLTIANSRHETGHFARKVPRMLFFGFFTLFISIAATLISFCGAHIYILGYKLKYAAIPLYALVVLPTRVFSLAQFRKSCLQLALATFEMNVDGSG
eukprot:XP_010646104.1 PREDICTED: uncharacterized protein LOC104878079 [Vitis vinifera]